MAPTKTVFDISVGSVFKVFLVLLLIGFLYYIKDILAMIFISIILAATFSPVVDGLAKKKIPRGLVIILIYLLVIGGIGLFAYYILPPVVIQIKQLTSILPEQFQGLTTFFQSIQTLSENSTLSADQTSLTNITNLMGRFFEGALNTTLGFFNVVAAFATVFVLSLYLLLEEDGIKKFFIEFFPVKQKARLVSTAARIGHRLGGWMRGQFVLALAVGLISYIGLSIMQVPYALTLAIIAGLFEIIPIIGPILAAIPAVLVAFIAMSPVMAMIVAIFYILVQEVENKLLVPQIMKRAVGLNPITIIIALLIGAKLMGIIGVLLAVPVASAIYVLLEDWVVFKDNKRA